MSMIKLTLKAVAGMSDDEIYKLSMPRPFHPEARGFMLDPQSFGSQQEMSECLAALMKRLGEIQKNK